MVCCVALHILTRTRVANNGDELPLLDTPVNILEDAEESLTPHPGRRPFQHGAILADALDAQKGR